MARLVLAQWLIAFAFRLGGKHWSPDTLVRFSDLFVSCVRDDLRLAREAKSKLEEGNA